VPGWLAIESVTALVAVVTTLPPASSTATTGWVAKLTPLVRYRLSGEVELVRARRDGEGVDVAPASPLRWREGVVPALPTICNQRRCHTGHGCLGWWCKKVWPGARWLAMAASHSRCW